MNKYILLIIIFIAFIFSCKKNKDNDSAPQSADSTVIKQQQAILANIGGNLIVPSYADFVVNSDSLTSKCKAFCANPTLTTLTAAQDAWKEAKRSWKRCEIFNNFGPGETTFIKDAVDYSSINTSRIASNISSPATPADIDSVYIEANPSTSKGLVTLEYLLFDRTDNNTIVTNYTTASSFENRKAYLSGLCKNLHDKATFIYNQWALGKGNYVTIFETNTKNDISGSLSLLVNSMIQQVDAVKTNKIGDPLGATSGTITPTAVEAYYSRYSFACIQENLACVQYLMTGKGYGSMNGSGISLLLNNNEQQRAVYNEITTNLSGDMTDITSIIVPLDQAVLDHNTTVSDLYNSTKLLVKMLRLDLASALQISVTYTDNDGDS
ncbi:MAG: Imelysin [Chitinophagaceae bacterium]|nr:Imelysin [Chitinophagaceae bacterium]